MTTLEREAPLVSFLIAKGLKYDATSIKPEQEQAVSTFPFMEETKLPLVGITAEVLDSEEEALRTVCKAAEQLLLDTMRTAPNIVRREEPTGRKLYRQLLTLVELLGHKHAYGPFVVAHGDETLDVSSLRELAVAECVRCPLLEAGELLLFQSTPDVVRIVVAQMPVVEEGIVKCSLTPQVRTPCIAHLRRTL